MRIIAGKWRSRVIEAPPGRNTRPTTDRVREAWMSMLQPEIPGSRVLDLFAGSGALGLETLSRGASFVTFVETGRRALQALRANLTALATTEDTEITERDALKVVRELEPLAYDIALADPPYASDYAAALVQLFEEKPFARSLWIEHAADEKLESPAIAEKRRYGDTAITILLAPDDAD